MKENRRILIIDDERPILLTLEALLSRHGFETETAGTAAAGLKALKNKAASLVLLDLQLPDAEGLQMLEQIKTERPETQVIILTAHDTLNNAIESIKRGAYHFISKPYAPEELLSLVEKALEKQSLLRETQELRQKTEQLEKRLEMAEMRFTPVFKSKAMQEIEVRPLGSTRVLKANFRVIAATNRPIAQALAENRLRSDLYYRLNTFQIEVPPLRERKQDIPPLVTFFVKQFAQQLGKSEPEISPEAFQKLLDYSWPGNVRELQNAMEYAVVLARQNMVGVKELPGELQLPAALQQIERRVVPQGVQSLDDMERVTILQALAHCHGNKKKAAELLGIQRPTLYNKLKRYAIEL